MSRRTWSTFGLITALTGLLMGCMNIDEKILSIFFDGVVPPPKPVVVGGAPAAEEALGPFHVHDPYEGGECTDCHDMRSRQVLAKPVPTLCFECHDEDGFTEIEKNDELHRDFDDPVRQKSQSALCNRASGKIALHLGLVRPEIRKSQECSSYKP